MEDDGCGRDSQSLCHFFVYHALDHEPQNIFLPRRKLAAALEPACLAMLYFISAYQLDPKELAHELFFREGYVEYIEAGLAEFLVRPYRDDCRLILQRLKFIYVFEQDVGIDEEMHEMAV